MPSFVRISHRVRVTPCDLLPGKINPWINIFRIIYHGRVFNSDNNKKYYDTVTLLIADKSIECSSPGHKRRAIEVTEIFLWNNLEIGFARDNQVDTLTSSTSLHSRRTSLRWLSRCSWYFSFFIFFFFLRDKVTTSKIFLRERLSVWRRNDKADRSFRGGLDVDGKIQGKMPSTWRAILRQTMIYWASDLLLLTVKNRGGGKAIRRSTIRDV